MSYRKASKSSGEDADGWMACALTLLFDRVHCQQDLDP